MRILIIDDVVEHGTSLEFLLKQGIAVEYPKLVRKTVINRMTSGTEALLDAEEGKGNWDFIFIDIELRKMNGIEVAGKLIQLLPETNIIFTSGYDDYYLDVYAVDHIYFLRKPIGNEQVSKVLRRMMDRYEEEDSQRYLVYRADRKIHRLAYRNILYFENEKRKIVPHSVQHPDGEDAYYGNIGELAMELPAHFIRCHSSYIFNLDKVEVILPDAVIVGGEKIPVSRKYRKLVQESFCELIEEKELVNGVK